ncbi:MAG: type IV secretion system protein [Gammaproteobacteria bacterium]
MMKRVTPTILLSVICSSAFADLEDVVAIELQTTTLVGQFTTEAAILNDQLSSMVKQVEYLKNQISMMEEQKTMMTAKNGYGDQWYGEEELWMPENFANFEKWTSESDRYKYYDGIFPSNPDAIDPHNETSREREQYEYSAKWNNYSRSAFAKKFDESYETVERLNKMIKEANNLASPKQSADFQIRMMGELAKLSQQQTELQALQLHLMTIQLEDVKLAKEHNAEFWKYTYED